jgi:hypothetical protein
VSPHFFSRLVMDLCAYYEHKEPKDPTMELWIPKVRPVPDEAAEWIKDRICATQDMFPRNLPNMIYALFFEWREAFPEKAKSKSYFACPDCVEGIITATKRKMVVHGQEIDYRYVFSCGKCRQSDYPGYPVDTAINLQAHGYKVVDPNYKSDPAAEERARSLVRRLQQKIDMEGKVQ